ncbi:MAG: hypothetical protein Q8R11_03600 [bacterium]|nr:hypothetical protein [bacterium]
MALRQPEILTPDEKFLDKIMTLQDAFDVRPTDGWYLFQRIQERIQRDTLLYNARNSGSRMIHMFQP